jgi:hypothetical protein
VVRHVPTLRMTVKDRQQMFGAGLDRRIKLVVDANDAALEKAARIATQRTRSNFKYRRDAIAVRPGRTSTGGKMRQHLRWSVNNGMVEFELNEADSKVQHWIIQELGTRSRGTIRRGGVANPVGRPRAGATYVRTVKSQKGRPIHKSLVFASGGRYSPSGSRRDEQLHWASTIPGTPSRRQRPRMVINKEIEGQHFVKKGGTTAFRVYRGSVLAAARQAFRKSNTS